MRIFGNEPRFQMISLEEDNLSGGADGQVSAMSDDVGSADTSTEPVEEPQYFHSITIPGKDGGEDEVLNFKDPKELSDRYLENRLRRADYSRKTEALANDRKSWEKKIAEYEEREQMLTRTSNKYNQFNELLGDLTPAEMQEVVNSLSSRKQPDDPRYKELKSELDSFKKERDEANRIKRLEQKKAADAESFNAAHKYLKGFYGDYDSESVMKAYEELMSADPSMAHQRLAETMYFATKGRAANKPSDPGGPPRTTVGSRQSATPTGAKKTFAEAQREAIEALGDN